MSYCLVPNAKDKAKNKTERYKKKKKGQKANGCHFCSQSPACCLLSKIYIYIYIYLEWVKIGQHGKRALNVFGVMVSELFSQDKHGYCW